MSCTVVMVGPLSNPISPINNHQRPYNNKNICGWRVGWLTEKPVSQSFKSSSEMGGKFQFQPTYGFGLIVKFMS